MMIERDFKLLRKMTLVTIRLVRPWEVKKRYFN
jgi:hypothetical protein